MCKFEVQHLSNTAWAFATVSRRDYSLFAALALSAEGHLSHLTAQDVANTVWAFATISFRDVRIMDFDRSRTPAFPTTFG